MNKVILLGRLTKDPIEGNNHCKFTVAVNRIKKGEADFISCVAFGKTSETIMGYLKKGHPIALEGHIQTGNYKKDGQTVWTTDVIVDRFEFVGGPKQEGEPTQSLEDNLKAQADDMVEVDFGGVPF